eukprot:m.68269 g.68269  ORF g.68269 m.68269 type:complete len:56 (-) comp19877_c1_seq2:68-235(-)
MEILCFWSTFLLTSQTPQRKPQTKQKDLLMSSLQGIQLHHNWVIDLLARNRTRPV